MSRNTRRPEFHALPGLSALSVNKQFAVAVKRDHLEFQKLVSTSRYQHHRVTDLLHHAARLLTVGELDLESLRSAPRLNTA